MNVKKYGLHLFLGQAIGIALLCLKLCEVIDWSWGWILLPVILSAFFETADFMPYALALTVLKLCGVTTIAWGWILLIVIVSTVTGLVDDWAKQAYSEFNEEE